MTRRVYPSFSVLLLFVLVTLTACQKSSTQPATAGGPSVTAGQPGSNQSVADNLPPEPTQPANEGAQKPSAAVNSAPIVIPVGTSITVRLQQGLSSAHAAAGEHFEAVLEQPLVSGDRVVVPAGTPAEGHVISAKRSGRLHHPGRLALTLDSIIVDGRVVPVATSEVVARGGSHKKRNWGWIGGGTGGGAVIGALAGGGEGALIGSGIGAAAGTTTAFVTGKKDVHFSSERVLRFRLQRETTVG